MSQSKEKKAVVVGDVDGGGFAETQSLSANFIDTEITASATRGPRVKEGTLSHFCSQPSTLATAKMTLQQPAETTTTNPEQVQFQGSPQTRVILVGIG